MKTMIFFMLHIVMTDLFGQDYIVKPDGTKFDGEIVSISKNILAFKNNEGDLEEYEIDKLHVVHISNPNFKMKDVNLNNTSFEKDDDGIHIVMLDYENGNKVQYFNNNSCQSYKSSSEGNSKTTSRSSTKGTSEESEINSTLSISSEDDGPKAKVILDCDDCSNSGSLVMESEDKLTNVMWTFDCKNGSAFPKEFEISSNKKYNFKYKDGRKKAVEKKVQIEQGVNNISVLN